MPTISNLIRQMDQSTPGLYQAKSSWSRDQWISVSPTERGRRLACITPHASSSLPFEYVSLSTLLCIDLTPVCLWEIMFYCLHDFDFICIKSITTEPNHRQRTFLGLLPFKSIIYPSCTKQFRMTRSPMLIQSLVHNWFSHLTFDSKLSQIKTSVLLC